MFFMFIFSSFLITHKQKGATPAHHLLDYECLMSHTTVAVRAESLFGARRDIPFFNTKDKTRIQIYVDFLAQFSSSLSFLILNPKKKNKI